MSVPPKIWVTATPITLRSTAEQDEVGTFDDMRFSRVLDDERSIGLIVNVAMQYAANEGMKLFDSEFKILVEFSATCPTQLH